MKKLSAIIILFVVLVSSASALTQINIYLDEAGNALFLGRTDENISLPAEIFAKNGKIFGETSALTSKEGEIWAFSYSLQGAELNAILPKGAVITELAAGDVRLEKDHIAVYNLDEVRVSYLIGTGEKDYSLRVAVALALVLIAAGVLYNIRQKKENKKYARKKRRHANKIDIVTSVLNEREKIIIGKLKQTGRIKMSYLRKACDIPKASFSRHIRELEKKGLVRLDGEGKNKFVSLRG